MLILTGLKEIQDTWETCVIRCQARRWYHRLVELAEDSCTGRWTPAKGRGWNEFEIWHGKSARHAAIFDEVERRGTEKHLLSARVRAGLCCCGYCETLREVGRKRAAPNDESATARLNESEKLRLR